MKIHHLTSEEALHSLGSGPNGLTAPEAHRRLLEFGPNRVEKARREPLGKTHTLVSARRANRGLTAKHRDCGGLWLNDLAICP